MGRIVNDFFSALRRGGGSLKRRTPELTGITQDTECRDKNRGCLSLDTAVFVTSLCIIALGNVISYILEQRQIARRKQAKAI